MKCDTVYEGLQWLQGIIGGKNKQKDNASKVRII